MLLQTTKRKRGIQTAHSSAAPRAPRTDRPSLFPSACLSPLLHDRSAHRGSAPHPLRRPTSRPHRSTRPLRTTLSARTRLRSPSPRRLDGRVRGHPRGSFPSRVPFRPRGEVGGGRSDEAGMGTRSAGKVYQAHQTERIATADTCGTVHGAGACGIPYRASTRIPIRSLNREPLRPVRWTTTMDLTGGSAACLVVHIARTSRFRLQGKGRGRRCLWGLRLCRVPRQDRAKVDGASG